MYTPEVRSIVVRKKMRFVITTKSKSDHNRCMEKAVKFCTQGYYKKVLPEG